MQIIYTDGKCLKNCLLMNLNRLKIHQVLIKNLNKFIKLLKNFVEDSGKGHILELHVEYPKDLHHLHSDLPFLPEKIKIIKCNKLVCNLYDKNKHVVHIRALTQALNNGLMLKEAYKAI